MIIVSQLATSCRCNFHYFGLYMTTGKEFRLLGLTQEQHDFLYEYAQKILGSKSRTKALLHLVDEKMNGTAAIDRIKQERLDEPPPSSKDTKRIQFSVLQADYDNLAKIAQSTDSSIQHYLRCLVRSNLYGKYELLGFEMENLRRSNYELYRLGVNINQIAKALNTGHDVEVSKAMLDDMHKQISEHTSRVEKILKDNLERYWWCVDITSLICYHRLKFYHVIHCIGY